MHARLSVEEALVVDASRLEPGTYAIVATVIDETPWVLRDPENLLTRERRWTLVVAPDDR